MGYRASRQASIKQSPYYMLYQQHMKLPIDAEVLPDYKEEDVGNDINTVISHLLCSREKAFKEAEVNIADAQQKQKETYARKHVPDAIPVGVEVLIENTADSQRKGGKLNPAWFGPYAVTKDYGKGIYQLSNAAGKILKKKVNVSRLKLYNRRSDSNDVQELITIDSDEKTEEKRNKKEEEKGCKWTCCQEKIPQRRHEKFD